MASRLSLKVEHPLLLWYMFMAFHYWLMVHLRKSILW
jgi:hypothetical protein